MRVACAVGRHERSGTLARIDGAGTFVSECKYCWIAMRRLGPKRWVVNRSPASRTNGRPRRGFWVGAATVAAVVGLLAGAASVENIKQARANGDIGATPVEQVTPLPPASTDEELKGGELLAISTGISTIGGCRRIAAEYRRGCLRYVDSRQAAGRETSLVKGH